MKIDLSNKTALILASSKGIGFSCALNLAKSGCNVILTGRSKENLDRAVKKIQIESKKNGAEPDIDFFKIDLNSPKELKVFENKLASMPQIDILILNSGGPTPGNFDSFSSAEDFEDESSKITYPAIMFMKNVLPSMKKNKWGRIINISSIGLAKPITEISVSNASRSFLGGLMVGIANENAQYGITLNTVLPGIIWTDRQKMLADYDSKALGISVDEVISNKAKLVPSEKLGDPDDVGFLVTFLSSDNAKYINGQFIAVDGGMLGLLR